MDEGERDILKEYSSVFGDRLDLRGTKGREFKENSTLNVVYGGKWPNPWERNRPYSK